MTRCLFVSDLHGRPDRYEKLLAAAEAERPGAVFLGGDLLPLGALSPSGSDFLLEWLAPRLEALRLRLGPEYPRVLAMFGNDDPRAEEESLVRAGAALASSSTPTAGGRLGAHPVYGYACVPPTPFPLKDWERYDVSRFVDPGLRLAGGGGPLGGGARGRHEVGDDRGRPRGARRVAPTSRARSSSSTRRPTRRPSTVRRSTGSPWTTSPLDVHVGSIAIRRFIEARQPPADAARPRARVGAAHRLVAGPHRPRPSASPPPTTARSWPWSASTSDRPEAATRELL